MRCRKVIRIVSKHERKTVRALGKKLGLPVSQRFGHPPSQIRRVWGIPSYYCSVLGIPRHPPGMYRSLVSVAKNILDFAEKSKPFVFMYAGKEILTKRRHLRQQQPLLNKICKEPPITSIRKERSLKDILMKTKL